MRFVHETKDHALVAAVLLSELRPQAGELVVCRAALSDDLTVEAGVVVLSKGVKQEWGS